jgi:hypothetical protein
VSLQEEVTMTSILPHDSKDRRVLRAETWIRRAKAEPTDADAQVIFYWIAFNALYGKEPVALVTDAVKASDQFNDLFEKLIDCDAEHAIERAVWGSLADPICRLMRNKFVFFSFWRYHYKRAQDSKTRVSYWQKPFGNSNDEFWKNWRGKQAKGVLNGVFSRLYVLRNQLMHGGARWDSGLNRSQVFVGAAILSTLIPTFATVIDSCTTAEWGELAFPPIDDPSEFDENEECVPPAKP